MYSKGSYLCFSLNSSRVSFIGGQKIPQITLFDNNQAYNVYRAVNDVDNQVWWNTLTPVWPELRQQSQTGVDNE